MRTQLAGRRWWGFLTAAVVLVLAAGGGMALGQAGQPEPQAQPMASTSPAEPGNVAWRRLALPLADIWMPFGPDGPEITTTGQWRGWRQTEQGAVQAGYMWLVCTALDNTAAANCMRDRYTGALTEQLAQLHASRAPVPRGEIVPTGYQVLAYSPREARIVYRANGSTMIVTVVRMDGDWRILAEDDASRPRNAAQVAPGQAFTLTPWGPADG